MFSLAENGGFWLTELIFDKMVKTREYVGCNCNCQDLNLPPPHPIPPSMPTHKL